MEPETNTTVETGAAAEAAPGAGEAKEPESGLLGKIKGLLGMGSEEKMEPETKGEADGADNTGEPGPDGKEGTLPKEPGQAASGTYSQEALDAAVKKAQEELLAQQEEEKRKAKLSPEEKAAEETAQIRKQNEELAGKLRRMELEQKAAKALSEKKLPAGLSEFLDYSDEARMAASLEKLGKVYQEELEGGIKERLKGKTPEGLGAAGSLTDSLVNAEIAKRIRGGF